MNAVGAATGPLPQTNRPFSLEEERMPAPSAGEPSPTPKFSDFVAILNPLQNLPVVGTVYRKLTGDEPHPAARVLGGLLWGGPIGLLGAALTYVAEQVSGKSATELVTSIFDGSDKTAAAVADGASPAAGEPAPQAEATPAAIPAAAAAATGTPAPRPPVQTSAQQPQQQGAITQAQPRNAAARDLAFYQAHAGSRLPAASSAPAPSGPQTAPQLPTFHRAVTPVLGPEPTAAPASPVRASSSAPAAADVSAAATVPETTSAEFAQRMLQGLERYRALSRAADAKAPSLDRAE